MKILKITMPHPSDVLSPNQGLGNRYAVNAARKAAKEAARVKMLCELTTARAGDPDSRLKAEKLVIIWYHKGRGHDIDNAVAMCKAYVDGACKALGVDDGRFGILDARKVKSPNRAGEVDLVFHMREDESSEQLAVSSEQLGRCPFCGAGISADDIMCATCEDEANFGRGELL